ncbi:MAG: phosphoesterase [Acidobacteria bacterium]|nr:phosphoesterase [Acidobacteriota bacterium]
MCKRTNSVGVCAVAFACAVVWSGLPVRADHRRDDRDERHDDRARNVFVIAMENHNWTQPAATLSPLPIFMNPQAPFVNSLVDGTSGISQHVAYATNYLNTGVGVHPSEPNYIWAEAGTNFGVLNDDTPYHVDCSPDSVQNTDQHLSAFLTKAHRTWRSYQEDTDVDLTTNVPLPRSSWTVPLFNLSGVFTNGGLNSYNYSTQYNYAAKHNPMVYFADTNGGCNTTTSNPQRTQYAPLQQLALDLQSGDIADYTWITPNQFNDMHTGLSNGYGGAVGSPNKGDRADIAQGDNFLARIVPLIMASDAYKHHGVIVLWWDESEGGDSSAYTLPFIVISKDAHENVNGRPFASATGYSHSSTLRTMQEIFAVDPSAGYPWLGAAAAADDLSAMFKPGSIR